MLFVFSRVQGLLVTAQQLELLSFGTDCKQLLEAAKRKHTALLAGLLFNVE